MRGNGFLIVLLLLIGLAVAALVAFNDAGTVAGIDEDRFADLAYTGIWGLVVASGIVVLVRRDMAGALRGALVWMLGFVVLIGLYSYRGDIAGIADRVAGELVPGRAVGLSGAAGRQVMVTRTGDGHFRLEATVDGEALSFLVDTGASVVVLGRRAAEAIGIDASRLRYGARVQTANGVAKAEMVWLKSVAVGEIRREQVAAAIVEGEGGGEGINLLGMSFLGTLSSFDFRGDRLVLTD